MTGIFAAERRQEYSPGRKPGVNIASSKSPGGTTEPSLAEPLPSAPTANDSRLHPKALKEFRKISLAHKVRKMLEYTTVKTRGGLHAHHRRLDCNHASKTPPTHTIANASNCIRTQRSKNRISLTHLATRSRRKTKPTLLPGSLATCPLGVLPRPNHANPCQLTPTRAEQ